MIFPEILHIRQPWFLMHSLSGEVLAMPSKTEYPSALTLRTRAEKLFDSMLCSREPQILQLLTAYPSSPTHPPYLPILLTYPSSSPTHPPHLPILAPYLAFMKPPVTQGEYNEPSGLLRVTTKEPRPPGMQCECKKAFGFAGHG